MSTTQLLQGDCLTVLQTLESDSVHTVVTSPPYWSLREYGKPEWVGGQADCVHDVGGRRQVPQTKHASAGDSVQKTGANRGASPVCRKCGAARVTSEIGTEHTPADYIAALMRVFTEVHRVLHPSGTCWVVIGDSFCSDSKWGGSSGGKLAAGLHGQTGIGRNRTYTDLKDKDLVGIPWLFAFAMREAGWWLRADIIWSKDTAYPESVRDRPTRSHEYIFLFAKSKAYFYDRVAILEPFAQPAGPWAATPPRGGVDIKGGQQGRGDKWEGYLANGGRNKRDVWNCGYEPLKDAHYAPYPTALIEPCVLAGSSEKGCCPECRAPWVRVTESANDVIDTEPYNGKHAGGAVTESSQLLTRLKALREAGRDHDQSFSPPVTIGWVPSCVCGDNPLGLTARDLEVIETPTGDAAEADPSRRVGRAGLARLRAAAAGTRPMTRYEQRLLARQLRASPHRSEMAAAVGETTFAHYIRTDRAGSRPVPPEILADWLRCGWVTPIEPPRWTPYEPVPCKILDPFLGSGTTAVVAARHRRDCIGIELYEKYVAIARRRLAEVPVMLPLAESELVV